MTGGQIIADSSDVNNTQNTIKETAVGSPVYYVWGTDAVSIGQGSEFNMSGNAKITTKFSNEQQTGQEAGVTITEDDDGVKSIKDGSVGTQNNALIYDGGVSIWANAKFTMSGNASIETTNYFALTGNGTNDPNNNNYGANTTIEISDNAHIISKNGTAVYHPQVNGQMTVTGTDSGTPVIAGGEGGIEVRSGFLDVTNATIVAGSVTFKNDGTVDEITATEAEYDYTANGSGSTSAGAAIAVAQHTTKKDIKVTIDGENTVVTGAVAVGVANPQNNTGSDPTPEVIIKNGTFTGTQQSVVTSTTNQGGTDEEGNDIPAASNVSDSRVIVKIQGGTFEGGLAAVSYYDATKTTEVASGAEAIVDYDDGGTYDVSGGVAFTNAEAISQRNIKPTALKLQVLPTKLQNG